MKSHFRNSRWVGAFLLIAVALCIMPAAPSQAQGTAKGEGVFLILSLEGDFDLDSDDGVTTLFVQIGTLKAGATIYNTRFEKNSNVTIKLPGKYKWSALNGNAFTVLGSFNAPSESVHLITPEEAPGGEPIPRKVQEAFFIASPELTEEFEAQFPTTVEVARFIYDTAIAATDRDAPPPFPGDPPMNMSAWLQTDHSVSQNPEEQELGPPLSPDMILQNIFRTGEDDVIDTTGDVYAEAEGDLFPHNPGDRLFGFDLNIEKKKKNAKVDSNMEIDVVIDIKPGNADNVIEKTDNGVVWTAVLTTTETVKDDDGNDVVVKVFDAAAELDDSWSTIYLGGAQATDYKIEDADHDGYDDITLKFRVNQIGLKTGTTVVPLTGQTDADVPMNIVGSDYVTIKK